MLGPQGSVGKHSRGLEAQAASWVSNKPPWATVLSWVCCIRPAESDHGWETVTAVYFYFLPKMGVFIAVSLFPSLPFYIWLYGSSNLSFSLIAATSETDREESTQRDSRL